jgi:hypothetical protein
MRLPWSAVSLGLVNLEAETSNGFDALIAIGVELSSQVGDVGIDNIGLVCEAHAPDVLKQLLLG